MRWWPWSRRKPVAPVYVRPRSVTAVVEHYGQVVALLNEHDEPFSTKCGDVYQVTAVRLSPAAAAAQEQRNRIARGDR